MTALVLMQCDVGAGRDRCGALRHLYTDSADLARIMMAGQGWTFVGGEDWCDLHSLARNRPRPAPEAAQELALDQPDG